MQPSITNEAPLLAGSAPLGRSIDQRTPQNRIGFVLFILTTVILFVRPADFVPSLEDLPIYNILIVAALLASINRIAKLFDRQSLKNRPYVVGVMMLIPAIMLSHLSYGNIYLARVNALEFSKVAIYFLLLVAVVDSPRRLQHLLTCLTFCILIVAVLALLQHYGYIDLEGLAGVNQWVGTEGDSVVRLEGAGIFHDPNDFSLILVMGIILCIRFLVDHRSWPWRLNCLLMIGILVYTLMLTQSRGGLLSLMAGLFVLMLYRFGRRKSLWIGAIIFPAVVALMSGRQTQIDLGDSGDTAQGRILIWRDCLAMFHRAPIFGIGYGQIGEEIGMVAHNSFVHAYTELGLLGGTIFVGIFYVLIVGVRQFDVKAASSEVGRAPGQNNELLVWRPYILAILWALAVGLFSLSRCYALPTYVVFGLSAVFCILAAGPGAPAVTPLGYRLYRNVITTSFGCLVVIHVIVKLYG